MRVGSGGVMLSHYSPYKVGRELPPAGGALSRPHRPGRGGGRRAATVLTAAALAYGNPLGIRVLPGEGQGSAGLRLRAGTAHGGLPDAEGDAGRSHRAGGVDARLEFRQRRLRRPLRPRVLARPLHRAAAGGGGAAPVPCQFRAGTLAQAVLLHRRLRHRRRERGAGRGLPALARAAAHSPRSRHSRPDADFGGGRRPSVYAGRAPSPCAASARGRSSAPPTR